SPMMNERLFSALILYCMLCTPIFAREAVMQTESATPDAYHAWFDSALKAGYRVVYLNGYDADGEVRYAAAAIKDGAEIATEVRYNLSAQDYAATLKQMSVDGFRPVC